MKRKIVIPENAAARCWVWESSFAVIGLNQWLMREAPALFSVALIGFNLAPRRTKLLRLRCNPATLIPRNFANPSFSGAGDGPHPMRRRIPAVTGWRGGLAVVIWCDEREWESECGANSRICVRNGFLLWTVACLYNKVSAEWIWHYSLLAIGKGNGSSGG